MNVIIVHCVPVALPEAPIDANSCRVVFAAFPALLGRFCETFSNRLPHTFKLHRKASLPNILRSQNGRFRFSVSHFMKSFKTVPNTALSGLAIPLWKTRSTIPVA